jgi:hypothetical protein
MAAKKKLIFISWTGEMGLTLAQDLKETFFVSDAVDVFVSADIDSGADWYAAVRQTLTKAQVGIVLYTPGSATAPWLNFEAGALVGKLNKLHVLCFGHTPPRPLDTYQHLEALSLADMIKLYSQIMGENHLASRRAVEPHFESWKGRVEATLKDPRHRLVADLGAVCELAQGLGKTGRLTKNRIIQSLVGKVAKDVREQIGKIEHNFQAPATSYPEYLLHVQQMLGREQQPVIVRAIALLDKVELFWHQETEERVRRYTDRGSTRIFVFQDPNQFERFFPRLLKHSAAYHVRAMALERLAAEFPNYVKDFSILTAGDDRVLATYDRKHDPSTIQFETDSHLITEHEETFREMTERSVEITDLTPLHVDRDEHRELILDRVFFAGEKRYERKEVEMSKYIDVVKYDRYEIYHPYYDEMMTRMIEIFEADRRARGLEQMQCNLLELGAGTGIFTRRLLKLPRVRVVALEIDWECHRLLCRKMGDIPQEIFMSIHADSRYFDPEGDVRYDYIFSSFSDHHIHKVDKRKYFSNVMDNLGEDALFIVGDEFLPDYSHGDRRTALRAYHGHIINEASRRREVCDPRDRQGFEELMRLEHDALESGLRVEEGNEKEGGDYKMSLQEYEQAIRQARFNSYHEKIAPPDPGWSHVGGVYVFQIWDPARRHRPAIALPPIPLSPFPGTRVQAEE